MAKPFSKFSRQELIFDEITWFDSSSKTESFNLNVVNSVTGKPMSVMTGMSLDSARPPYWEFKYKIDKSKGLSLSDIVVRDSQAINSLETVFESIEFSDIKINFQDGQKVLFDIEKALSNVGKTFEIRQFGSRSVDSNVPDFLFQRGLKLTLADNVLGSSGFCMVTVEMSVVFRGANNDIDPGGIPVGMKAWPQIALTWQNALATKKVASFEANVKILANNKMYPHNGGHVMNQNIASLFTDSNTSMTGNQRGNVLTGRSIRNTLGMLMGAPSGWSLVFDYAKLNVTKETQLYGAISNPPGHTRPGAKYIWPDRDTISSTAHSVDIKVEKHNRQLQYDNIHLHAAMHNTDQFGNTQIHAPFCGHSCVHAHWRWSSISSNGAIGGRGWQFKGWSDGFSPLAHSTENAPLVPPNQNIRVALTIPNANMFSDTEIINTASPQNLDPLRKLFWYRAEVKTPNAGERQVIMDHGLGWAYRYCITDENSIIEDLYSLIHPVIGALLLLPQVVTSTPNTQTEVSDFFELEVYPFFRYIGGLKDQNNKPINQIPPGNYDKTGDMSIVNTMEEL